VTRRCRAGCGCGMRGCGVRYDPGVDPGVSCRALVLPRSEREPLSTYIVLSTVHIARWHLYDVIWCSVFFLLLSCS
jgi:hypothetical protein